MSDQGEVWNGVAELQVKACCMSPTSAMSDVYKAREDDLRKCDEIFKPVPGQVGLIAVIDGQPVGMDLLSLTSAYAKLHPKLVRSYTLEALLVAPKPGEGGLDSPPATAHLPLAQEFLAEITSAEERQFPSVGHGTDFRYRSSPRPAPPVPPAPSQPVSASQVSAFQRFSLTGSALVHENEVIHAAFFRLDETEQPERMASYRARRRHGYE